MPQVIVFASPKGGSGATFACANVARMLAENSQKVLAVDMCFETCTLDSALGFQDEYVYTFSDVLNGDSSLEEAVCSLQIDFLRADYENNFFDFDKAFDTIKHSQYDFVLIDAQCNRECLDELIPNVHKVVVVTDCSPVSVKLAQSFASCAEDSCDVCILINKIVPYYIADGLHLTIDEVIDGIGHPLLGMVPWDCGTEFVIGTAQHDIKKYPALSESFSNIASRLMGQRIPACDIERTFRSGITYKYFMKGRK